MLIIGGNVNGLFAALEARKAGLNVTVIDAQFPRSSSEVGNRHLNVWWQKPKAKIQARGLELWKSLLAEVDLPVVRTNCLVYVEDEQIQKFVETNLAHGETVEVLTPAEAKKRFSISHHKDGVFLKNHSRIIDLKTSLEIFRVLLKEKYGVKFLKQTVVSVKQVGERCQVLLGNDKKLETDYVAVCAGPWTSNLLVPFMNLNTRVTQQQYLLIESPDFSTSAESGWPLVEDDIGLENTGGEFYTNPGVNGIPTKLALDNVGPEIRAGEELPVNLDEVERVKQYAFKRFGGSVRILGSQVCRYSLVRDWGLVLDFVPTTNRISFSLNCAGGGCKTAPAVAESMLDLLLGRHAKLDMSSYRLNPETDLKQAQG